MAFFILNFFSKKLVSIKQQHILLTLLFIRPVFSDHTDFIRDLRRLMKELYVSYQTVRGVVESRIEFYSLQRFVVQLVSQRFWPLQGMLHCAMCFVQLVSQRIARQVTGNIAQCKVWTEFTTFCKRCLWYLQLYFPVLTNGLILIITK